MKILRNQRGFAVLEVIVFVAVLGVLGFAGYRYYQAQQTKPVQKPAVEARVYKDRLFSVDHPSTWKAHRSDNESLPGTARLSISGPDDPSLKPLSPNASNVFLTIDIFVWDKDGSLAEGSNFCDGDVEIFGVSPLDSSFLPGAKLAITSELQLGCAVGDPSAAIVTQDPSITTKSRNFKALVIDGRHISIVVEAHQRDPDSAIISSFDSVKTFKDSTTFKQAESIIETLEIKL